MAKAFLKRSIIYSLKTDSDHADYVRVIGAGLPRTGTSSLKAALELLGFGPCHHMVELFDKPERSVQFIRALDGKQVDFYELMKGYGSTVDSPTSDFYKEIYQIYPKAKIILTVRDNGEKWFESFQSTIASIFQDNSYYFAVYLIRFLHLQSIVCRKIEQKWINKYGNIGPSFHDQYNNRIINENKDGEILIYNVKEGWSPLCKFLGVDIPEGVPFPHVNDATHMQRVICQAKIIGWCVWTLVGALVIVVVYLFFRFIS
ncbi:unnamed protein product [Rotaria sp. Silwood2]|nr:unnamed protein product [Rotaria sp. Silwood2]